MLTRYTIETSYHQIYVVDSNYVYSDSVNMWDPPALSYLIEDNIAEPLLGKTPSDSIVISTKRWGVKMGVEVELLEHRPILETDAWDHVVECSLNVPSGRIIIYGLMYGAHNAPTFDIAPGTYNAFVYYGGFDSLSEDGLEGNDHYRVTLWPGTYIEPHLIK